MITVGEDQLTVSNPIRRKNFGKKSMGIGLQNLKDRYQAITGRKVEIEETADRFTVRLPIVPSPELQEISA
jgi:signal transduction histidine kinase